MEFGINAYMHLLLACRIDKLHWFRCGQFIFGELIALQGRNSCLNAVESHTIRHDIPNCIVYLALIAFGNTYNTHTMITAVAAAVLAEEAETAPASVKSKNENRKFTAVALTAFSGTSDCNYRYDEQKVLTICLLAYKSKCHYRFEQSLFYARIQAQPVCLPACLHAVVFSGSFDV